MKKQIIIDGKQIEVMYFKKRSSAMNFKEKSEGREIVFFNAHNYYVSI